MAQLAILVALNVVILVHEMGHYVTAKMLGIRVFEFSVGFGPKVASMVWRGDTFSLRWLPFGGYVKFAEVNDDDDESESEEPDPRALSGRPAWQRMLVSAAGSVANIALCMVPTYTAIAMGKPVNGKQGWAAVWEMTVMIPIENFKALLHIDVLHDIVTPIALIANAHEFTTGGLAGLASTTMLFSVSIGTINLMPFPGLDGWGVLTSLIEMVARRPLPKRLLDVAEVAGLLALLVFGLYALGRDALVAVGWW